MVFQQNYLSTKPTIPWSSHMFKAKSSQALECLTNNYHTYPSPCFSDCWAQFANLQMCIHFNSPFTFSRTCSTCFQTLTWQTWSRLLQVRNKKMQNSVSILQFFVHCFIIFPLCTVKTNDMMLVIYLSSLIRSVIALHNLISNKVRLRFSLLPFLTLHSGCSF